MDIVNFKLAVINNKKLPTLILISYNMGWDPPNNTAPAKTKQKKRIRKCLPLNVEK